MKRLTVALLVASALLAGCGQKGPLYMPDTGTPAKAEQTQGK